MDKNNETLITFSDLNSKGRRKLIDRKLVEFNQSQSYRVVECDRLQTDPPIFIEVYAEVEPDRLVGGLVGYIDWGRWFYIDVIWVDADYRNNRLKLSKKQLLLRQKLKY